MPGWFEQNAEKARQLKTPPAAGAQPVTVDVSPALQGGDWFKKNAPLLNRPGEPVTPHPQQGLPDITNEDLGKAGRFGLDLLPAAGGFAGDMIPGPLGVAASGALGGVGEGIRQGVLAATGAEGAPQSIPEAMKNIGIETAVQAGTSAIGSGISKALGKVFKAWNPTDLLQSAVKPLPGQGAEAAAGITSTMLRERIPASEAGREATSEVIKAIHRDVESTISARGSEAMEPRAVVKRLDALRERWSETPAKLAVIDDIEEQFLEQYGKTNTLTLNKAQAKKMQLYKEAREGSSKAYAANRVGPLPVDVEAQKELARGIKEELIDRFPQLASMGEREGSMIALQHALDRFVARDKNRQMINGFGILSTALGVVGGGAFGHPEAALAPAAGWLVKSVMDDPLVKSRLAFALDSAGKLIPKNTGKVINLPNAIRLAREGVLGHPVEKKEP